MSAQAFPKVPRHVGIILDGNRRFARRLMLEPWKGHEWGYAKLKQLIDWCVELGVEELTVYVLSLQNLNRPHDEYSFLMDLAEKACDEFIAESAQRPGVRLRFIGKRDVLPSELQKKMRQLEETTLQHQRLMCNICLAYGGREEITDAVKSVARLVREGTLAPDAVTEDVIAAHLQLPSEPDVIIRTGGEHRTSNFLNWQASYTEWYFTDVLWPEFSKEEFLRALADYTERERRFGR